MAFFVMFIIWYNVWGKNNPRVYNSLQDKLKKIIFGFVALSMFTSFIPNFLAATMFGVGGLLVAFLPLGILMYALSRTFGKKKRQVEQDKYTYNGGNATQGYANYATYDKKKHKGMSLTGLTKSVPKRRKIVSKFNKKYDLTLTDKEIDRIVDASYMSYAWEREIYDMEKEYDAIHEWYNTDTCWLRAYLRAFAVQSVSSDFEMQRQICLSNFDQIFNEIRPGSFATIDDCIDAINNKYMTFFDESAFMIAYRFLEMNGRKYDLPSSGILRNESDLDRLKRKYDEESVGSTEPQGTRRMI